MPSSELLGLFRQARRAAADEIAAIALVMPPGARDAEVSWLLAHAPPAQAGAVVEALEPLEIGWFQALLEERGGSRDPAERDPALVALARAGVFESQPLVARALRTEPSESSLVLLAHAAGGLGPLLPVEALKVALARARTPRALIAITDALGPALDAEAVRILASRGSTAGAALEHALRLVRRPESRAPAVAGDRRRAAPFCADAAQVLHARAAELAGEDAALEAALSAVLGGRVRGKGPGAASAAAALGALGSRGAAELARALGQVDGPLALAVSAALSAALRIAPERRPEDAAELRRAWFPILATLVPGASMEGLDRL